MNHWIIVPVVLPAIMGAFTLLVLRTTLDLARVFSTAATLALLAVSVMLLHDATVNGPEVYFLGDWPAPFGIVLVLDRLSALMVALTAFLALAVQLYAIGTGWDRKGRHFHALWQFQLMGVCGAFLTGDAFNLFVFFEVLLIASYGLMIHGGGRDRLKAGVQYVAYNLLGSTLFLFALATIYSVTGTLNMADLAVKLPDLPEGDFALMRAAGVMLLMVFAIKGALVPLHFWLPATYAEAPGPVAALFAVMTKVGAYAVIRCYTLFFPEDLPATGLLFADLLLPAALITLFVGAFGVMGARNLGRVAAFAAITSMGTLFTAVAQFTPEATAAALYYAVHSTLAGGALFLIADLVVSRRGTGSLTEALPPLPQNGLIASFFMASAIATAGMPPLSGFLGKLLILDATRGPDMALVWGAILVSSFLVILGLSRTGSTLFWKSQATPGDLPAHPAQPLAFVATGGLLAALALWTVAAGPATAWLEETALMLHTPDAYIAANKLGGE
ncbi:multisubunit potassium/proton antiporter PhaD subunit [Gemmobacter caeni]|jgi:multicomponent K+:H+ antiporter subunit D|uniref:Multisubunit potassium/proton antiporter PhaD subunit n=2 Tax=Gemmobacter TaxID=204456 RepID=A0A2T6ASI6_9RHOB|nr:MULTISPECIES: monovalent cation/H+ antiporter subunit D [Gemmobacter]OJY25520.1 MAG: monovalent cation/H+ antiporter subunit D [Rhodobacterales bacterium 65-51]PTX46783.1 multisubunit potassium/proton antiporter PhaD subunit [Gemmobacter caeni]TWI95743.1 multisubunit potassium/proton antiporter PhaD subunit [Gemmobacter caeni]GHC23791.1 monovalent cation/H+ antiporter subunit D [Gemmobacter nanjingensis]